MEGFVFLLDFCFIFFLSVGCAGGTPLSIHSSAKLLLSLFMPINILVFDEQPRQEFWDGGFIS
jgi:hypothetical protein